MNNTYDIQENTAKEIVERWQQTGTLDIRDKCKLRIWLRALKYFKDVTVLSPEAINHLDSKLPQWRLISPHGPLC